MRRIYRLCCGEVEKRCAIKKEKARLTGRAKEEPMSADTILKSDSVCQCIPHSDKAAAALLIGQALRGRHLSWPLILHLLRATVLHGPAVLQSIIEGLKNGK